MDIMLQLNNMMVNFFDIQIAALVLGLTQLAKYYLPDNIEGKWVPLIAVVVGIATAIFLKLDILKGLMTALIVSGTFGSIKDIFNGDKK